ncbi:MAG: tRNA pseudouridine32 synthase/23S rRNA pseudouridine746 synthase [Cellvibrionaceae bacterium]|jgi:tRNA pseudouridine32 synthase/23S rRNA pseudouridine746 synthase
MESSSLPDVIYQPDTAPIRVIFEDDTIVIVDKPSNLLTTPGRGADKQDCLYSRLLLNYPNLRVVHRLDMATSGLVIFALSHQAQVAMGKLFEQRLIQKTYIAIVSGRLEKQVGEVDLPLICDWENRPTQKVCHQAGKAAQTRYSLLKYDQATHATRVQLEPLTGRSHQLRVHMLSLGHPIVGDALYHPDFPQAEKYRLLLHAHKLEFMHPLTQQVLVIISELPF